MKTSKRLFTLMALALVFALTLTACGNQSMATVMTQPLMTPTPLRT